MYASRHAFAWLKRKRTTCRLEFDRWSVRFSFFLCLSLFLFCRYRHYHHGGLSELQSRRFTLIVLTSNVVGSSDLVNMNHIQLDYTIVPTPTPRLLESRLSKKNRANKRKTENERENERNRDIHIIYFEINCTFTWTMTLVFMRNPYSL